MPWRSRLIASTRSSRSVVSDRVLGFDLAQLFLGAQVDGAQARSRSRRSRSSRAFDLGATSREARCPA